MNDILADIQRCLGAQSVDLPSGLDIIPMVMLQQPGMFARQQSQSSERKPEGFPRNSNTGGANGVFDKVIHADTGLTSRDSVQWPSRFWRSADIPRRPASAPRTNVNTFNPEYMRRPLPTDSGRRNILANARRPTVSPGSVYSSMDKISEVLVHPENMRPLLPTDSIYPIVPVEVKKPSSRADSGYSSMSVSRRTSPRSYGSGNESEGPPDLPG